MFISSLTNLLHPFALTNVLNHLFVAFVIRHTYFEFRAFFSYVYNERIVTEFRRFSLFIFLPFSFSPCLYLLLLLLLLLYYFPFCEAIVITRRLRTHTKYSNPGTSLGLFGSTRDWRTRLLILRKCIISPSARIPRDRWTVPLSLYFLFFFL